MARSTRVPRAAVVAALVTFAAAAPAEAAQRWAVPTGGASSGTCAQAAPCTIANAVNHAASGDEVVVQPGTYRVAEALDAPGPIDLHGVAGQPRPRLVGADGLTSAVVTAKQGGSTRHLRIDGTSSALVLQDGIAEDLLLSSTAADGAKVVEAARGTVLRDSVVVTSAGGSDDAGIKLSQSQETGTAALVNVTVLARQGEASGIVCNLRGGSARIVNTIARGAAADIDTSGSPALCSVSSSNLRAARSPGVTFGGGDQDADPLLVDETAGDLRLRAGSPAIDVGTSDPDLGRSDPAGCPRLTGAAPDIGAYEYAPATAACATWAPELVPSPQPSESPQPGSPSPSPSPDPVPGTRPAPKLGQAVVLAAGSGTIRVRRPGARHFRSLAATASVPVGSVIDATGGRVRLSSALDASGTSQTGTFWGARFEVRQGRRGMTTLLLRGGDRHVCRRTPAAAAARHPAATMSRHRRRHRVIRSLWGRDHHGRFRTHGANSVATVRGTHWLTQDRCDGTLTRVRTGKVAVRDLRRHRTVLVRAGHAYLARARD